MRSRILPYLGGDARPARLAFIAAYAFPPAVAARFADEQRKFNESECAEVFEALKDYFAICAADPARRAGMPSRIVDEAWHTFILFTREYTDFCERAFGRYLHHAPAGGESNEDDLRHTWRVACARENIPVTNPPRLPQLFSIDRRLAVPNGRYYALNETDAARARQMMGANATVALAVGFGLLDSWNDPIFAQTRGDGFFTPFGGGADAASTDFGGGDTGGGGGCSGGGN